MTESPNYWQQKRLEEMTTAEWEALCDGCGKCCIHKLEHYKSGEVTYTNVACRLLDLKTIRCSNYRERKRFVPDCTILNVAGAEQYKWLPDTCAYRLVAKGHDLPSWHPLKTGDPLSTQRSGNSVKGKVISERDAGELEEHVVSDRYFEEKA